MNISLNLESTSIQALTEELCVKTADDNIVGYINVTMPETSITDSDNVKSLVRKINNVTNLVCSAITISTDDTSDILTALVELVNEVKAYE